MKNLVWITIAVWLILFSFSSVLSQNKKVNKVNSPGSFGRAILADQDNDGLSDSEEAQLGTSPTDADTDDDALLDGWEVRGINGINLVATGASPLHKDIFVEMDFMTRATASAR